MRTQIYCLLSLLWISCMPLSAANRWVINPAGGITWQIDEKIPHEDHIEMSGLKVSTVLRYGVNEKGAFMLNRSMIWPMLRTIPNNTHASLMRRFAWNITDMVEVNGQSLQNEKVTAITLNGTMQVQSEFKFSGKGKLELTRILFPSTSNPAFCEKYSLKNTGETTVSVEIPSSRSVIETDKAKGVDGSYKLVSTINGQAAKQLKPGEELIFSASFAGYKPNEKELSLDIDKELQARQALIAGFWDKLVLDTPDPVINTMFAFAKIRGAESIYDTKGGLLHGPGGESYYAAIWANDQAEYINPFFPYLGYEIGNRSAFCSYEHFARFMNPEYKALPSSIIAEGTDIWAGAGDRGDAAMVAYGASRYALARGDKAEAEKLWPLIEWTLEYCKRNLNEGGVVASDADELEGRFPAGKANLCTSSLYYDALRSAVYLGKDLGKKASQLATYAKEAETLKKNMDRYFGGTVEGFDTYQYYEGNDVLRSWICIPLTVGIYDRKDATIQALFSPRLWTPDGLLTQAGSETFWDRSTLYALRGVYACGETEKATDYLKFYSNQRLLGEHVPYAIEAWPEGNQRHLSAESGLYCRIITEGMFGIRPTGLKSFSLTPRLPKDWDYMNLGKIGAFGGDVDIEVKRLSDSKLSVVVKAGDKVLCNRKIKEGEEIRIKR
ncbi:hypothetical protein [Parabacteroides sp. AM08-6]|uniref:hypothetical protein n=1 Tax=Parabacteroides sp. AM08-6 TaxID=2292053 RepID=UPI000EFE8321|nr:hypothetical protein [Parabacteroides sp. AM08-6]RHJ80995.1 hypothetical protein DW103_11985 [Parabacteroides sp. AM08-6]